MMKHLFQVFLFLFLMLASLVMGSQPTINTLEPFVGPSEGGNLVIMTGTNFTEDIIINFGSTPAHHTTILSETTISAVVPPGVPGTVAINMTRSNESYPCDCLYTYQGKSIALCINDAEATISVIDMTTKETLKSISSIELPQSIAITPDGTKAYVTDVNNDRIIPIDIATQQVQTAIVSPEFKKPKAIAITPDGQQALVTNLDTNSVTLINLTVTPPLVEKSIAVDIPPHEVIISPEGDKAYVLDQEMDCLNSARIVPIDMLTKQSEASFNLEEKPALSGILIKSNSSLKPKSNGCLENVSKQKISIIPDPSPVASFTATIGIAGMLSSFDASSSHSPIGSITLYEWDFGDGTMKTTLEPYTDHCYASSGSFCATLKVTNSQGTSTEQQFIGSLLEKNGGPLAMAAKSIEVRGVNDPKNPDLACNFTTIVVTPSQNPVCVEQPVHLSAVLPDFTPTSTPGTLSYYINLELINTVNVSDLGIAPDSNSITPSPGLYIVYATYSGDNVNCSDTSNLRLFTVNATAITASATPNPICVGQLTTISATGFPAGATGTVTFSIGATVLCTATLPETSCTTSVSATGSQTVTATYSGDTNNCGGSTTFNLNVSTPTTTTVSANPHPICLSAPTTLTATVSPAPDGGTVSFSIGSSTISTCTSQTVDPATGEATCTFTPTTRGPQIVGAQYSGDATYCSSSETGNLNVLSSTTTMASFSGTPISRNLLTFLATVTGNNPTGTVTFSIGSRTLCTAILSSGSGTCNYTVLSTDAGSQTVTATYSGDANNCPSSTTFTVVVGVTSLIGTSSPNPSCVGESVTLSATVTSTTGLVPTGTVTFSIGSKALCTATLSGGSGNCSTDAIPRGAQRITAVYSGDVHNSSAMTTFMQVVRPFVRDARVIQRVNRFATQSDRVNIVTWKAPHHFEAVTYQIYCDAELRELIGVVHVDHYSSHEDRFRFEVHNRKKNHTYRYFIIGVDAFGNETCPSEVVFRGHEYENSGFSFDAKVKIESWIAKA
jgi:DNA-binding beta-propeller fold protein YncE